MMSDSVSASDLMCFATKVNSQINSLYSFDHFANCTSDLSVGTCRRLPIMGEPLGPGGSGYFDLEFEPCEYSLVASNITRTPPKMATYQLPPTLARSALNDFMMSDMIISVH